MKKITLGLLLISLFAMSACNVTVDFIEPTSPPTESGLVKSDLARETAPQISDQQIQALTQDNTAFALSFFDQIREDSENIIFSPISLSIALSMTLAGAEASTEAGMMEALQFSLPEDEIYSTFNALLLAVEESQGEIPEDSEGSRFQLNIANSIWGQASFDFKEPFLDTLALHYGAGLHTVDFIQNPQEARIAINDWVEEETAGKIEDLIPPEAIDNLTRLVLANAIYFNGSWLHPFDPSNTEEGAFKTLDGVVESVEMMKLYEQDLPYAKGTNHQVVSLPYLSTDFSMSIIVPDEGTFEVFEDTLSPEDLADLWVELVPRPLNLKMPKFDFESAINANDPLKSLGMAEAFDADLSDFTGIADVKDLHITDVVHQATINVDEEGTEAAAATAVIIGRESAPIDEPLTLVIDRPFLFIIRHNPTNSILFMGRVLQP